MKVTFLGTGTSQGVPPIGCTSEVCRSSNPKDKRLRTSIHIEIEGKSFIIDCGPDFRYQMLRANIQTLDAIIFTHEHKDHTAGLDDIRAFNFLTGKPVEAYLHERVLKVFEQQYDYIFSPAQYLGIPKLNFNLITDKTFYVEGVEFVPINVLHYKLPVLGFKIRDFVYITDANYIDEEEIRKIYGCKTLVLNALHHKQHISHFTLEEAVAMAKKIGAEQTYFVHMSHHVGLHDAVNLRLPKGMELAFDGLQINI